MELKKIKVKIKIKEKSSVECDYEKDCMKIKFNSDDNLPLNKQLKFHNMTITISSVFEVDGNYFVSIKCIKMLEYDKIDISEGIDIN